MEASYPARRVKSNMQRNSTFERHKIGKYMFFSQFSNIFLTYQITLQVASTEQKISRRVTRATAMHACRITHVHYAGSSQ